MAKKKIFGITASIATFESGELAGEKLVGVNRDYTDAVHLGGALPVVLPPAKEEVDILNQLEMIDLLIVSGGADLQPSLYGEVPSPLLERVSPERDQYEMQLVRLAHAQGMPIFGICRGLQLINVAFGGKLYQDLSEFGASAVLHRHADQRQACMHPVEVVESTLLYEIFQQKELQTNSYHHQGIKLLAPEFRVNAYAADGLIEGVEKPGGAFLVAVQWHPEMMAAKDSMMLKLFRYLSKNVF
jgi:putative glutamine amidotransferase